MNVTLAQTQLALIGLLLQILSIIFVWNTVRVSDGEIGELGAGAILGSRSLAPILGTRTETVRSALRRQYESLVGMIVLFLGITVQMFAAAIPGTMSSPIPPALYAIAIAAISFAAFFCGRQCVVRLFKSRVVKIFRSKAQTWKRNPPGSYVPDEDALKNDLARALGDAASDDEINELVRAVIGASS